MRLRTFMGTIAVLAALLAAPVSAHAWSNGPDGMDSFGTHDWIFYQALVLSKQSWVDTQTALFATDDPDSKYGDADKPNHLFLPGGAFRGGPDTVTTLYRDAMAQYQAGDTIAASRSLGLLSHYYSDLCVPFHSMTGYSDSALHLQYELAVNAMTTAPESRPDFLVTWSRGDVNDVRAMAVQAALTSRSTYPTLATQYLIGGFNETTDMITRVMLSRAANDIADIIRAIPEGTGVPPRVSMTSKVSHSYPAYDSRISITATCLDTDDRPAEGVRVRFNWGYPSGQRAVDAFTGTDGTVRAYADSTQLVMGQRVNVSASVPESQGAVTAAAYRAMWFVPTDYIGYVHTEVSTGYPAPYQPVTASTLVLNSKGQPLSGLPVTFTWDFKSNVYSRTVSTGLDGTARATRNIGNATKGYKVVVNAQVPGGGVTRSSSASFVTQNDVASMQSVVSSMTPTRNSSVTVYTTCLDAQGRAMAGVPISFAWRFRSGTWLGTAYTNSAGVAHTTRNIKMATRGYPVHITAATRSGAVTKNTMVWFTPR